MTQLKDGGKSETMVMMSVIRNGGIAPGGFNFDAKLRRESTDVKDLFIAHISGMDTIARGMRNAVKILEIGKQIKEGKPDFEYLEKKAKEFGEPEVPSAKQELAEMIFQSAM